LKKGEEMPKILSNVKESLLKEGSELLKAKGYSNLNIREVAKNCEVSVGTLYNYFSNKDELVREIILTHWNKVLININTLTTSEQPLKDKLITLSKYLDNFFHTYSGVFAAMMESTSSHCPRHKILPELYTIVETMINLAKEKGEVNPPLSSEKVARILVPSMFFLPKMQDLTFEDFYSILDLGYTENKK